MRNGGGLPKRLLVRELADELGSRRGRLSLDRLSWPDYAFGMTLHTAAIYEAGVLRPLTPLGLQENQVVSLSISTTFEPAASEAKAARQRDVVLAYVAKVESRPDVTPQDGYSNRDHDRLIYGK